MSTAEIRYSGLISAAHDSASQAKPLRRRRASSPCVSKWDWQALAHVPKN